MKASERLREVHQLALAPWYYEGTDYREEDLRPLLPLIADVVEAAEQVATLADNATEHYNDLGMSDLVRAPLTALRAALSADEAEWPDGDEVGQPTC